jgi:putative transposase
VERSLPAARVIEALDTLLLVRGRPQAIVCDYGPEFVSLALDQWAIAQGIRLDFIRPGHPVENCFIESFNGKLRDECLDQHDFVSLAEALQRIEIWRQEYHTERQHRGLGQRTPAQYAASFTPRGGTPQTRSSDVEPTLSSIRVDAEDDDLIRQRPCEEGRVHPVVPHPP